MGVRTNEKAVTMIKVLTTIKSVGFNISNKGDQQKEGIIE